MRGSLADAITESFGMRDKALFYALELKKYFEEIYKISRSPSSAKDISDRTAVVFLQIVQKLTALELHRGGKISPLAESVKNRIDNITDFSITLDEIVKAEAYSKCHIIREFKTAYNQTPYKYMLSKRFETAKIMLKNTAVSISDIADELNFCDVHYFSGCFSKRFGVSPSEYRKG